jgi:3-isopropylmalate/(R)-2-methylmalate dehydratase large subunit
VSSITGRVPRPSGLPTKASAAPSARGCMGLRGGEKIVDIALDRVFIGSCTNT